MAVYKATYCYPFQSSLDIRVVPSDSSDQPYILLKCKIDTSNKKITGYKIRVLDDNNNVIFPFDGDDQDKISPLSEIQLDSDPFINSGENGTFLNVPFFQNKTSKKTDSYNAVYYTPKYAANYDITGQECQVQNNRLSFAFVLSEEKTLGDTVYIGNDNNPDCIGIWRISELTNGYFYCDRIFSRNDIQGYNIVILNGDNHNKILNDGVQQDLSTLSLWEDIGGNKLDFDINKNNYKWEITLYQGEGINPSVGTYADYMDYTALSYDWYDNVLNQGTILGSTNKRIQIANKPSNEPCDSNISLPSGNILEPLVLQEKWIQLLDDNNNQLGQRQFVQSYDATMGHVYPISDGFTLDEVTNPNATKVCFYKHSNRIEDILAKDIVDVATTSVITKIDMWGTKAGFNDIPNQFYQITDSFSLYGVHYEAGSFIWWYNWDGDTYLSDPYWIVLDYQGDVSSDESLPSSEQNDGDCYFVHKPDDDASGAFHFAIWVKEKWINFDLEKGVLKGNYDLREELPTTGQQTGDVYFNYDDHEYALWLDIKQNWVFLSPAEYYGAITNWQGTSPCFIVTSQTFGELPYRKIDNIQLSQGLRILVKDAWDPIYNGIYIVQENAYWTRSGSYDTWGELIGAIIFVDKGTTNGSKNFQSLVSAGGVLRQRLDSTSDTDGASPVYFCEEEPEVLYIDQLTNTVDAYAGEWTNVTITSPGGSAELGDIPTDADGVPYKVGQTLLVTDDQNHYFIIAISAIDTTVDPVVVSWTVIEQLDPGDNIFIRISNGKVWGGKTITLDQSSADWISEDLSLSTAYIQKNNEEYTYISPFTGLQKGMALYLLNNAKAVFSNNSLDPSWLSVKDVNTTVWKIKNDLLNAPFESAVRSKETKNVPYKYEVRSFFKTSDENPFVSIEYPYIKVFSEQAIVQPEVLTNQRYIDLEGKYVQFQQGSWESYRWILTDVSGNILQDTGKRFDKSLDVSFYGLSSNYNIEKGRWDSSVYYATLEIEDNLNNTLSYTIKITSQADNVSTTNVNFYADFDCSTHSVKVSYEDSGLIYPVVVGADYAVAYNDTNPNWDSSLNYSNSVLNITESNGNTNTPVFNIYYNNTNDQHPEFSYSIKNGIEYSNYFGVKENFVAKDDKVFELDRLIDGGEVIVGSTIQESIEFQLNNNYCGNVFDFTVDFKDNGDDRSLAFTLEVPDSTILNNGLTLNPDRNEYLLKINDHSYATGIAIYPETIDLRLNMIPSNVTANVDTKEYLPYVGSSLNVNQVAWYKKSVNSVTGQNVYLNSDKPLGNLCLFNNTVGSDIAPGGSAIAEEAFSTINFPSYWVEQGRGRLVLKNETNTLDGASAINLVELNNTNLINEDDYLVWPADDSSYQWIEPTSTNNYPTSWSNLNAPVDEMSSWKAAPRHEMNNKIWTVKLILKAEYLDEIFNHYNDLDINFTNNTAIIKYNNIEYGSMTIQDREDN